MAHQSVVQNDFNHRNVTSSCTCTPQLHSLIHPPLPRKKQTFAQQWCDVTSLKDVPFPRDIRVDATSAAAAYSMSRAVRQVCGAWVEHGLLRARLLSGVTTRAEQWACSCVQSSATRGRSNQDRLLRTCDRWSWRGFASAGEVGSGPGRENGSQAVDSTGSTSSKSNATAATADEVESRSDAGSASGVPVTSLDPFTGVCFLCGWL